jgi:hypothetical protein
MKRERFDFLQGEFHSSFRSVVHAMWKLCKAERKRAKQLRFRSCSEKTGSDFPHERLPGNPVKAGQLFAISTSPQALRLLLVL